MRATVWILAFLAQAGSAPTPVPTPSREEIAAQVAKLELVRVSLSAASFAGCQSIGVRRTSNPHRLKKSPVVAAYGKAHPTETVQDVQFRFEAVVESANGVLFTGIKDLTKVPSAELDAAVEEAVAEGKSLGYSEEVLAEGRRRLRGKLSHYVSYSIELYRCEQPRP